MVMSGAETAKDWIGAPSTSMRATIGSSALAGRLPRMRSMASLVSCTALSVGISIRYSTEVVDTPSCTLE